MKVALFLVDDFEDIEALMVVDLLRRANIEIDTISLEKHDMVRSAHNVYVRSDYLDYEVKLDDYDAYILPGGSGYQSYFDNKELIDVIVKANKENRLIAAICAAPSFLASLKIVDKTNVYPSMKDDLLAYDVEYLDEKVVIRDNIITAQAMGSATDFALEIIAYLKDREIANKIRESIYY